MASSSNAIFRPDEYFITMWYTIAFVLFSDAPGKEQCFHDQNYAKFWKEMKEDSRLSAYLND